MSTKIDSPFEPLKYDDKDPILYKVILIVLALGTLFLYFYALQLGV